MHGDATQYRILEPVVKRAWRVDDPESLPDIMDKAFRLAESGRPGPVLIDMPMDMFSRRDRGGPLGRAPITTAP